MQHSVKDWLVEGKEPAQTKPEHLMTSELETLSSFEKSLIVQVPEASNDVLSKQS